MVRVLDCCAKHRWFEPNPWVIVGMLAHCPPSSEWVPGGNTGETKGGEERNWPPYLTMPAAQDKCPSHGHSSTYGIVHGTHLYKHMGCRVLCYGQCHGKLGIVNDFFIIGKVKEESKNSDISPCHGEFSRTTLSLKSIQSHILQNYSDIFSIVVIFLIVKVSLIY